MIFKVHVNKIFITKFLQSLNGNSLFEMCQNTINEYYVFLENFNNTDTVKIISEDQSSMSWKLFNLLFQNPIKILMNSYFLAFSKIFHVRQQNLAIVDRTKNYPETHVKVWQRFVDAVVNQIAYNILKISWDVSE